MQVIKKVLLILYTLILGFIVFCNTSVFAEDTIVTGETYQLKPYETSNGFESYFSDMQDYFDYRCIMGTKPGYAWAKNRIMNIVNTYNYNYFVEAVNDTGYGSGPAARGYVIYLYNTAQEANLLTLNENFEFIYFDDYTSDTSVPNPKKFRVPVVTCYSWYKFVVYNNGQDYVVVNDNSGENFNLPFTCLNYYHHVMFDAYIQESTTNGGTTAITNAIESQTNTIKKETQKQTNAIVSATQSQTNELLDTNNTGNDTMSVNDTTTDTSADLTGIYNSISSAFTDSSVQQPKSFDLTLPNGDTYTFGLSASILTNFLNKYPVLKAFYQAFFYVVFCGYVIFDFKRIINKLKEGDIDNVVGSSNPVDSVVNMSLK